MADTPKQEIKLFYCYARKDRPLRDELEIHLSWVKRRYQLTTWYDREILPGEEWEQAIDKHLNSAHLILLLISPDFMNSDYSFGKEMQKALERHKEGTCRVLPILLRPTYWEEAPFSSLQLLPSNAKPITSWSNPDEAFQNVVTQISHTIKDLLSSLKTTVKEVTETSCTIIDPPASLKTGEDWLKEGVTLATLKRYEEALAAYEQAIYLNPKDFRTYLYKGNVLHNLERYEEALAAYEQTIRLNPTDVSAYEGKSTALSNLKRYREALIACEQSIRLDPKSFILHEHKGWILRNLWRDAEAEQAFEKAKQLRYKFLG